MRYLSLAPVITVAAALSVVCLGLARPESHRVATETPPELVATYDTLADAILAVKKTEANLVQSILATTYGHARMVAEKAVAQIEAGQTDAASASIQTLAALVAQLGTEGDNAVAGIRKRLIEGGHHHNAEGEKKGIYDPGFVIVTREAKKSFLDASRAIARMGRAPAADGLQAEWTKVEATWMKLMADRK